MPKVSVVIPAYNAMAYLPMTVASALEQTFKNFEIIVVNDGSTDEIVDWFANVADERVKLISHENKGLAEARNTGIKNSQGQYIAFLDADDLWEKTKLEKQVDILDSEPSLGLVYNWVAYIDENDRPTGRITQYPYEGDIMPHLIRKNILECGSVALVRRECFDTVGIFDPQLSRYNLGEDWDMWLRIAAVFAIGLIKEPLVYYRQHPSSSSKNWRNIEECLNIVLGKAFSSASADLLTYKSQSYGNTNFYLAWKAIQSRDMDYRSANKYRQKAIKICPELRLTKENIKLLVVISAVSTLGPNLYQYFLGYFYFLRHRVALR